MDSSNHSNDLLASALMSDGRFKTSEDILEWFKERQAAHKFKLEQIPFSDLRAWGFDPDTGNLCHESGKFFSIEGIRVKTNFGPVSMWEQPIINQPEIGFLGFITKKFDGVLHFLVQAKMEPGNINMIQLSPTLQATRSNFSCVHQGRKPHYLEYFEDRTTSRVLVDSLQSEQGSRFLRKRNRNIIIETDEEVQLKEDYCWVTLGQLLQAMRHDNLVNMDARTVISCIDYGVAVSPTPDQQLDSFGKEAIKSLNTSSNAMHSNVEIMSWFTEQKFRSELDVDRIPLREVDRWTKTSTEIRHETGRHFSVIACSVEADSREVFSWTQPLVKAAEVGIIGMIAKPINGVLHFLMQAKSEAGIFDSVEIGPTVQCMPGSYADSPPFLDYMLQASPDQIRLDTLQSEEGGRFYREENRNLIIEAGSDFPESVPDNYIWMTAGQLKEFIKYNNFVNVQARCLISTLSFN